MLTDAHKGKKKVSEPFSCNNTGWKVKQSCRVWSWGMRCGFIFLDQIPEISEWNSITEGLQESRN
jgi:hypothetical protein